MDHRLLAQISLGILKGLGPLGGETTMLTDPTTAIFYFIRILSLTITVMTLVAFIWFLFTLFIGAVGWLGSGGDKANLEKSQRSITQGITGLVIVISSIFIVKIIETVLGLKIISMFDIIIGLWPIP